MATWRTERVGSEFVSSVRMSLLHHYDEFRLTGLLHVNFHFRPMPISPRYFLTRCCCWLLHPLVVMVCHCRRVPPTGPLCFGCFDWPGRKGQSQPHLEQVTTCQLAYCVPVTSIENGKEGDGGEGGDQVTSNDPASWTIVNGRVRRATVNVNQNANSS
jgi:hypothetical protein